MGNNITELVFILDRSGSMAGLEQDTIGGFNALLAKQRNTPGQCWLSTVLFDNDCQVLHDRVPLDQVQPLTEDDYSVGGCTALMDALGGAIHHIGNIHKYARKEDVPERTLFVITTDGMENASRRYSSDRVKAMVQRQKAKYGWEFLFLAANIDAVETAKRYGIDRNRAVNYQADGQGTDVLYDAVSDVVSNLRSKRCIQENWSASIQMDNRRKRK